MISRKNSMCITHLMILIDPVYRSDKSYYPPTLLDKCKLAVKEKTIKGIITEDQTDSGL